MSNHLDLTKLIFGRLTLQELPLHVPIVLGTFAVVMLGAVALLGVITYYRLWGYLGGGSSIDHRRSGSCT